MYCGERRLGGVFHVVQCDRFIHNNHMKVVFFFILAGNCFWSLWLRHSAVVLQEILWLIRSLQVVRFVLMLLKSASHRVHSPLSSVVTLQTQRGWNQRLAEVDYLTFFFYHLVSLCIHVSSFYTSLIEFELFTHDIFCAWDVNWKYSSCEIRHPARTWWV